MKIFHRLLLASTLSLLGSACVYRINIQQGNFLDQAAVEQVKPGMTRSQVRYLLGTPMVADSFNRERWITSITCARAARATSIRAASRSISTARKWRSWTSRPPRRPRRRTSQRRRSRTGALISAYGANLRGRAHCATQSLLRASPGDHPWPPVRRMRRTRPLALAARASGQDSAGARIQRGRGERRASRARARRAALGSAVSGR